MQADGSLWCWGYNSSGSGASSQTSGQLGVGDTLDRAAPARVGMDIDWQSVSAGVAHTCALKTTGTLWCWGESSYWGRLGLDMADPGTDVLTPAQVTFPAVAWTSVAAGQYHTCGIGDGDVYCWGLGVRGATGRGRTATDAVPVRTGVGYRAVAVGATRSCGEDLAGHFFCWGQVSEGRTGTGVDPTPPDGGATADVLSPTAANIL